VNATLLHAPRALAATVAAFALAIVIALIASAAIGTAQERLGERPTPAPANSPSAAVSSPTWANAPLASPLDALRQVRR